MKAKTLNGQCCPMLLNFYMMATFLIQAGSVMRLPKFEVDLPAASKAQKTGLLERDVTLANM